MAVGLAECGEGVGQTGQSGRTGDDRSGVDAAVRDVAQGLPVLGRAAAEGAADVELLVGQQAGLDGVGAQADTDQDDLRADGGAGHDLGEHARPTDAFEEDRLGGPQPRYSAAIRSVMPAITPNEVHRS